MALQIGKYYEIQNVQYGTVMNLYGNLTGTTIPNATPVSLYSRTGSLDQQFAVQFYAGAAKIVSKRNPAYVVNRRSDNNTAMMWPAASASVADTEIDFLTVDASQNLYRLRLNHHNLYLTATGTQNILYFHAATGANNQLFKLLEPGGSTGGDGTPGASVFNGRIVSQAGAGRCLNVYGNDTIENHRNVCLWDWSGTPAQEWNVANYNGALKVFSRLTYPTYALNIYRANNNCDVFAHVGNDADSQIYLTGVAGKAGSYFIRIAGGTAQGLALTAEGAADGSNVSWQPYDGGIMQQWLFTTTRPSTPSIGTIHHNGRIVSHDGNGRCLNVYGNDTIDNHRNVCLWQWSGTESQRWVVADYAGQKKVFSALSYSTYALNVYRNGTNNCDVFPHVGNDADSHVSLVPTGKANTYYIKLADGLTLTAGANQDEGAVNWQAYTGAENQRWLFTTTEPTPPGIGTTLHHGHIVSYGGAGYTLNIIGNEQVSNNRNVNVWQWSIPATGAQTWRVAQYGGQYKIFSSLSYPTYALNISRDGTNNCDILPHAGNDGDSKVMLSPAGQPNTYFIRLVSGGLALTASAMSIGANVEWRPYTGSQQQVWLFTNTQTGPVAPPPETGTADSPLVNVYMQAHSNNYTPNRAAQGGSIQKITIHHCAGVMSVQSLGNLWQNPSRGGSSHYGVSEGQIGQYVMEKDVAWTDGNWTSNIRSVTIETSNSGGAPTWPVSETTFQTLVRLVADIARRNNLGTLVKGQNLTWHQMFAATECPGPYLLSRMDELVVKANAINAVQNTNFATYPMKNMRITQDHNGATSHAACSQGVPYDLPFDEAGADGGIEAIYCPVDEMKVEEIYAGQGTNAIWLRSTSKVKMPCGEDYLCMMVIHPETNDLNRYQKGHNFHRGDEMFFEGTSGGVPAHFHISCALGDFSDTYWANNTNPQGTTNTWVITTTGDPITAEQAFYLDSSFTTVHDASSYTFIPKP